MINTIRTCVLFSLIFASFIGSNYVLGQAQYIDVPAIGLINVPVKPGWTLVYQDEFQGTRKSNWINRYWWGNSHPSSSTYHYNANYVQTASSLKLRAKEEFTVAPGEYVLKPHTSAMLNSDNGQDNESTNVNHKWKYGYFEMRCKNPLSQRMWPGFWLYGKTPDPAPSYEIDIFEFGNGDGLVMTNHRGGSSQAKWLYTLPEQNFGGSWVTYGMKWEPNKIVWYINNRAVHVVTNQGIPDFVSNIPMRLKVTNFVADLVSHDIYLPSVFPNEMEIDYIRVYQRADYNSSSLVFTINGSGGGTLASPLPVPYTPSVSIWMDASESYVPNHNYTVQCVKVSSTGVPVGAAVQQTFTNMSIEETKNFDINLFCASNGLGLQVGSVYRVTLSAGQPLITSTKYISIASCTPNINFRTNGGINTAGAIIAKYNHGKSRVVIDARGSVQCAGTYYISIQECNSGGSGFGPIVGKYLSAGDIHQLGSFDLDYYAKSQALDLGYGKYYRIRLGVSPSSGAEKVQLVIMQGCPNGVDFAINGQRLNLPNLVQVANGGDIIVDGTFSTFCNDMYFLSIQECSAMGLPLAGAAEVHKWHQYFNYYDADKTFYYTNGRIDIRDMARELSYDLGCGKYYRIKMAISPWVERVRVIYIQGCSFMNNSYMVNGVDQASYTVSLEQAQNLKLYAPTALSCDRSYFVALQKRVAGVYVGVEAADWLTSAEIYDLRVLGDLSLNEFASDRNLTIENNSTYRVKLVSGVGTCNGVGWVENNKTIYVGTGSGNLGVQPIVSVMDAEAELSVFPNPTDGGVTVRMEGGAHMKGLRVYNMSGSLVLDDRIITDSYFVDMELWTPGLYVFHVESDDRVHATRISYVK